METPVFYLFPAYAGVILTYPDISSQPITFPRIRGGDPNDDNITIHTDILFPAYAGVIPGDLVHIDTEESFSPHTRG